MARTASEPDRAAAGRTLRAVPRPACLGATLGVFTLGVNAKLRPARLVSPGIILRRELDARGWTQRDLAEILGRPAQAISEIVQGSKRITAETALELSAALETSAEVWLQLDAGYRLRLAEERPETASVLRAIVKRSRERAKRDKFVISPDVANAFEERELPHPGVVASSATTATDVNGRLNTVKR